jgi:hypothetical protein
MDKIDVIIDALECAKQQTIKGVMYPAGYHMMLAQALAAARELQALKPVGYGFKGLNDQIMDCTTDKDVEYCIPLYALDEETK